MRCAGFAAAKVESYFSRVTVAINRHALSKSVELTRRGNMARLVAR